MRTLKKTLCLVLCLAMMVGLCAIGANAVSLADYADAESITHKEAVAVLSNLKVLEGDERGFRPNDPLTRAESAAFFTRLMAQTGAGVSSFTDMAGYDWAQPYVAFCESNKLIAGRGDGTFAPGENVTVVQWGKMCLVALGYNPAIEGLIGSQWEINTIRLLNKIDLCAGMTDIDYNAAITRDGAAQMGLNTLKATMVEYNGGMNVDVNTNDGTEVHVSENPKPDDIDNNSFSYYSDEDEYWEGQPWYDDTLQFCEEYFPTLKLTKNSANGFGVRYNYWWIGNSRKDTNRTVAKTIISEIADNVIHTYDANVMVTGKQIYADALATKRTCSLTTIVNGYTLTADTKVAKTDQTAKEASGFPFYGYKGATILLLDTDYEGTDTYGVANKAIVKVPYLAKVTKVVEATASASRYVEMTVYNNAAGTKRVQFETTKYAKDDYILVYLPGAYVLGYSTLTAGQKVTPLDSALAETVNGTLSKVNLSLNAASTLTIGGVAYTVGNKAFYGPDGKAVDDPTANYTLNTGMTAFLSNGYVLGVEADAVSYADYVFAIAEQTTTNTLGKTTALGYVKQDGTTAVANKYYVPGAPGAVGAAYYTNNDTHALNLWVTTTEVGSSVMFTNKNNNVEVNIAKASGKELNNAQPTYGTGNKMTTDSKTVFVIRTDKGFSVYNGLAALPTINLTADVTAYALVPDGDTTGAKHAAAVYLDLTGKGEAAGDTTAKIWVVSTAKTTYTTEGATPVYYYTAIVDGAVTDLKANAAAAPFNTTASGFLAVPTYDSATKLLVSAPYVVAGDANNKDVLLNSVYADGDDVTFAGDILTINGVGYRVDTAAKVYVYDAAKGPAVLAFSDDTAVADLEGTTGFYSIVATPTSTVVKAIYVYIPAGTETSLG